jgi:hypothetical protein
MLRPNGCSARGALDDKRAPGPASRCALQQACAALGQQAGLGALAPLAEKLQSMSQDIGTHGTDTGG